MSPCMPTTHVPPACMPEARWSGYIPILAAKMVPLHAALHQHDLVEIREEQLWDGIDLGFSSLRVENKSILSCIIINFDADDEYNTKWLLKEITWHCTGSHHQAISDIMSHDPPGAENRNIPGELCQYLVLPGHQQPWHWICKINITLSSMGIDFKSMHHHSVWE